VFSSANVIFPRTQRGFVDRSAPSWTTNLLDLYVSTIDVFSKYQNVLGYHVGNEVVITSDGTGAAAFVKAAARDVKAYLYVRGPPLLKQVLTGHHL
jgi:hypothetical protein